MAGTLTRPLVVAALAVSALLVLLLGRPAASQETRVPAPAVASPAPRDLPAPAASPSRVEPPPADPTSKPAGTTTRPASATPGAAGSPAPAAAKGPKKGFSFDGDLLMIGEANNYFRPPNKSQENAYGWFFGRLRLRGRYTENRFAAMLEMQDVQAASLPTNAIGRSPVGTMGTGASAYAYLLRPSANVVGVSQAWVQFGKAGDFLVQAGRMSFQDGMEAPVKDEVLGWLKRHRISQRLISPGYTRSFDGVRVDLDSPSSRVTGFVAHPTQSELEAHYSTEMPSVLVSELAWTATQSKRLPNAEGRVFWNHFDDSRQASMLDNRPSNLRGSIFGEGGIHLDTYGLNYVTKLGRDGDAVIWAAHQTGKWGRLTQDANAFSLEMGLRPPGWNWKPWIRAGYSYYSGDSNPRDGVNGTFLGVLNGPRLYSRFNAYNESNLHDVFAQFMVFPGKSTSVRMEYHVLSLDNSKDLWYTGEGALQEKGYNGNSGRPSNGSTALANVIDLNVEQKIDDHQTVRVYVAKVFGGSVVRKIFTTNAQGGYGYLEYSLRF